MINSKDRESYLKRYDQRLEIYGYDPRALGWGGGKERQRLRFRKLFEISRFIDEKITSVLDVGCGFGDFYEFMALDYNEVSYHGLDINENLLNIASEKYPREGRFTLGTLSECKSKISRPDVVIESGMFNAKLEHESQIEYVKNSVREMYEFCKFGVAADFMTDRVDWVADGAFHLKPDLALEIGFGITKKVILRHDYLPYEYCIYLLK